MSDVGISEQAVTSETDIRKSEEQLETGDGSQVKESESISVTESSTEGGEGNSGDGLASKVAAHYNTLPEAGREKRLESRIFFQRNFNNWIKSMCIADALKRLREKDRQRKIVAFDLCCGKGGDLLKWKKGQINHLVCADIAAVSVEQCEQRYKDLQAKSQNDRNKLFTAEFYTADCAEEILTDLYKTPDMTFDLTSCQFSFHYSFETIKRADTMLRNACERLKPGGLFVGTIPNGCELVRRVKHSEGLSFGNDVYRVTFKDKENFPLFGCIYDFHLEGVVDCPEFLVYFPLLERMAKKYGMRLLYSDTFAEFFKKHSSDRENCQLLSRMKALEAFPPFDKTSASQTEGDYDHAAKFLAKLKSESGREGDNKRLKVGTLSKAEWEAASLYLVFAFIKEDVTADKGEDKNADEEEERTLPEEEEEEAGPSEDAAAVKDLEREEMGITEEPVTKKQKT